MDREELTIVKRETLPDGKTKLTLSNGGVFIYPPLPEGDWKERVAKKMCDTTYSFKKYRE